MKKLLTMFAIVCAFLASCDSEGGDLNRTPLLKVVGPDGSDPSQPISIDGKSQEVAFTVLATADWTADIAGDEGFALSDRSGATGNTKVTVVAARNLSGATRSATVSFRLGGEERYAYTISQTEEQPYLDVDPATISIVGDHTEFTVAVSTNQSPWKVEIDSPDGDGWLTQQSKESASITFLAEENTTGRNRTATLKFVSELHPEVFNYVTVTQGYVVPAPTADLLDETVDMVQKRKSCVIGTQVWKDLFPGGQDPTGRIIKLSDTHFRVVGVLRKQSTAMSFSDVERTIVVPVSLAQQMFGRGNGIDMLAVAGHEETPSQEVDKACREAVFARHIISPEDEKAVWSMATAEIFEKVMGLFRGIALLTWIVGLGTLLAGVIPATRALKIKAVDAIREE